MLALLLLRSSHTYQVRAVIWMSIANALHFGAYELARSAVMAIMTSPTVFQSSSIVTTATAFVSPFSVALLWIHRKIFDKYGPRRALLCSTFACCSLLSITSITIQHFPAQKHLIQFSIFAMFVAKSAFVYLISTQHWSFITSILSSNTKNSNNEKNHNDDTTDNNNAVTKYTPIIAGCASVVATAAGWMVTYLLQNFVNLPGLLHISSTILILTAFCSDSAYRIAQVHGFEPIDKKTTKSVEKDLDDKNFDTSKDSTLIKRAMMLFRRVPVLGALCIEVLICQSVSSFLSYMFVTTTKQSIQLDEERAKYNGKIYARINFGSGVLQFVILPLLLPRIGTSYAWISAPVIICIAATLMIIPVHTERLIMVTASYSTLKTLEYSLRSTLIESVYSKLDYESRFFGKEILSLFANRLGKSTTALLLAGASAFIPGFLGQSAKILICFAILWLAATTRLIRLQSQQQHSEPLKQE